jgi:DNA mismatch endonuclease, patch repair protein
LADTLTPAQRSRNMASIRGKNTTPELVVRRLLHELGYRYRIHYSRLSGSPDVAFPGQKKAIFVHGCYWHRHPGCKYATTPKSRPEFWQRKFDGNILRDQKSLQRLAELGWTSLVIWECETRDMGELEKKLLMFVGPVRRSTRGMQ